MNILITLPKNLIDDIISGKKKYEMRKYLPKFMWLGVDGFFVVEKGTDKIRCWCRMDEVKHTYIGPISAKLLSSSLCVSKKDIERYAKRQEVYLWKIGKVVTFTGLKRDPLLFKRNPQRFAYCALLPKDWF